VKENARLVQVFAQPVLVKKFVLSVLKVILSCKIIVLVIVLHVPNLVLLARELQITV
jgi:hypothetical protein